MTSTQQRPGEHTAKSRPIPVPNAGIWPGLATPPSARLKGAIAKRIFRAALTKLPVRAYLPDGTWMGAGGPTAPKMNIVRPDAFFARLGADAKIGFGEAYMVGDWVTGRDTDLADLLTPFAKRMAVLVPPLLQRLRAIVERTQPTDEINALGQAQENIERHYDLSNELFTNFLDATMSYSSALYESDDDLLAAQHRKIEGVLDFARVKEGMHVLEIGTGWGQLALQAAERGARVTSLTLSTEQAELARKRIADAGYSDRVQVLLRDYREANGQYDAIVSVEMIEAVGVAYWPTYFESLDRLLAPGGRVGLQAITMPNDRMQATKDSYTWIHKYVFPGGIIPSVEAIEANLRDHTTLEIVERRDFGLDYARTLHEWRETFLSNWAQIEKSGFDRTFKRMWEFYLGYCEAGFRSRYLGVSQFSFARPAA